MALLNRAGQIVSLPISQGSKHPGSPAIRIRLSIKEWHVKRDKVQGASAVMEREERTTLTRPEAVRRAIEALGYRAEVSEILAYVREHFGVEAVSGSFDAAEAVVPAAD